jgi:hypothetical protein
MILRDSREVLKDRRTEVQMVAALNQVEADRKVEAVTADADQHANSVLMEGEVRMHRRQ